VDESNIRYDTIELYTLSNNMGNEVRAESGIFTKLTSVLNTFLRQQSSGGCNDGNPGLMLPIKNGN
jgi:hypothetical protein